MKKILIAAAVAALAICAAGCAAKAPTQSPEAVFNSANAAMSQGDYAKAIELFYTLYERYPQFKTYRCDVVFRLGYLLYKAERFDESEKVLVDFIKNYAQCQPRENLKKAYIILISIYLQEIYNDAEANRLRDEYIRLFGRDNFIKDIDRTVMILKLGVTESPILKLDPAEITIKSSKKVTAIDRAFYPVINYVRREVRSPNNRYLVKRSGGKTTGYYLYLTDTATKKTRKLSGTMNGYAPQWSWDSRYIFYTSMDWETEERKIKVYDLKKSTAIVLFKGKNMGDVITISPDASKIVFSYYGRLWIMNRVDANMALLSNSVNAGDIVMLAWNKNGGSILARKRWSKGSYGEHELGRTEIQVIR